MNDDKHVIGKYFNEYDMCKGEIIDKKLEGYGLFYLYPAEELIYEG